jgi:hypothetical protein
MGEGMDFVTDLARRLYDRRQQAVVVPFRNCSSEAFQPVEQDCHRNVDLWCKDHPSHTPVHGWVVFEVYTPLGLCRFIPHSVVEDEHGFLFDITPSRASRRYPFLKDELTEEEYVLLITSRQLLNLDHKL